MSVTVCIPSIPPRSDLLKRALKSVSAQTRPVTDVAIAFDTLKQGAGPTRSRALATVRTEWTAFLDDDDELKPKHVDLCLEWARATDADVVYPWFDVVSGGDPFPMFEGQAWDPAAPHIFPITVLAKTEAFHAAAEKLGGFPSPPGMGSHIVTPHLDETGKVVEAIDPNHWSGDDWPFWWTVNDMGYTISHLPERTWLWHHDSGNTSGLPTRW